MIKWTDRLCDNVYTCYCWHKHNLMSIKKVCDIKKSLIFLTALSYFSSALWFDPRLHHRKQNNKQTNKQRTLLDWNPSCLLFIHVKMNVVLNQTLLLVSRHLESRFVISVPSDADICVDHSWIHIWHGCLFVHSPTRRQERNKKKERKKPATALNLHTDSQKQS